MNEENEVNPEADENGASVDPETGEIAAAGNGANGNGANADGNGEVLNGFGAGNVRNVSLDTVMRTAYLDYAMSVIVARALPDARDGLKPVHRRILYGMYDLGVTASSSYKKSARIVGDVLGKYHPHGDSSVYDAMARMAQDFSLRYMLVDGQGNFGSVDGDSPAAMRYTEARLSRLAEALLQDLEMDTVDWQPNFDDSLREPQVLPAMLPNFLVNGTSGIAVGMATNVPPHNLREVADAIVFVIDNWERRDEVGLEELMQFVKGPDFPTGGIILGTEGITQALGSGNGRIIVRARTEIEETKNGQFRIIVTEIPYQVNKSSLIEKIAELVRDGRIEGIRDLRDESDRKGMRIVIELKSNAAPKKVRNRLFKHTALQSSFSVNTLALVNGEPRTLSLRQSVIVYIEHRQEVITRRTEYQLGKARERAHILEGLRIALEFLDEVIRTIRESESAEAARVALMNRFNLSQVQAQAILDMQLRRLANLERQKIEDEYQEIIGKIAYYMDLLANPEKIRALVREDILMLREKFGDKRRTSIAAGESGDFNEDDLIAQENVLVAFSSAYYIKRVKISEYREQIRGGTGYIGTSLRKDDGVRQLVFARTLDTMILFTDRGRAFTTPVHELPEGSRTSKGQHIANVLNLQPGENVTTMVVVPDFNAASYITLITRQGKIKRMDLALFANVRANGRIAMGLEPGDSLDWARLTNGDQEFMVVSRLGKASRFHESLVRPMGVGAFGVLAMKIAEGDSIVSLDVVKPDAALLVITEQGWGKRVNLDEYAAKGRNIQGNWTTDHTRLDETGPIVAARVVNLQDQISVISANGIALRTNVAGISQYGRITRGVRIMKLKPGDVVATLAVLNYEDLARGVDETGGDLPPTELELEEEAVAEAVVDIDVEAVEEAIDE